MEKNTIGKFIAALLIGAALSVSGAMLQSIFANSQPIPELAPVTTAFTLYRLL